MRLKNSTSVRDEPTFTETARRAQIVACAIETIARLGYGRASLAEIAKQARISKSVISYYFATKDELIRQVVTAVYATGMEFMVKRMATQIEPAEALRTYIISNVAFIGEYRTQMRALVEIIAGFRSDDGTMPFEAPASPAATGDLEKLLRWGQQSGAFRDFAPTVMAVAIRAAMDALPWRLAATPDIDLDAYANELAELFDIATRKEKQAVTGRKR